MNKGPKYKEEEVVAEMHRINKRSRLDYEKMMKTHGNLLTWARKRLKHNPKAVELWAEIRKKALKRSARRLAREEDCFTYEYVSENHPGLEKASREVYPKTDGICSWKLLIEDTRGLKYPCATYEHWTLKKILREIKSIGDNLEDFKESEIIKKGHGLRQVIMKTFGAFGKGVMLTGVDYTKHKNVRKKEKYAFTEKEIGMIMDDDTLGSDEKALCLFNGLSLQYYPFQKFDSKVERWVNLRYHRPEKDCFEKRFYLGNRLELFLERNPHEDLDEGRDVGGYVAGLALSRDIKNKAHTTEFHFSGKKEIEDANNFYMDMENLLGA